MSSTPNEGQRGEPDECEVDERNRQLEEDQEATLRALTERIPSAYQLQGTPEVQRYASVLIELAAQHRGNYLTVTTHVEEVVDQILPVLFCGSPDQRQAFRSVALSAPGRVSFNAKIDLCHDGLRLLKPDLHREWNEHPKRLYRRLRTVQRRRNLFAHGLFDRDPDYLQQRLQSGLLSEFRLIAWTEGQLQSETFTIEDMQALYKEALIVTVDLADLLDILTR